jgi:hypothetical protein
MMFSTRSMLAIGLFGLWFSGTCASGVASAAECQPRDQVVVQAYGKKVALYNAAGEFIGEVDKSEIITGAKVRACDKATDHVRIQLTGNREAWVDRLEVEIRGAVAAKSRECKDSGIARPADQTTPATSGIDPCRH